MKYYLSGPMSGYPEHNFPMFKQVASNLRQQHLDILDPSELPAAPPEVAKLPTDQVWSHYLKQDMREMLLCDAVILLPEFLKSRGARLELYVADKVNMFVYELNEDLETFRATRWGCQDDTQRST